MGFELTEAWAGAAIEQTLGYLNYSAGGPDPAFQRNINRLFGLAISGRSESPWKRVARLLKDDLVRLSPTVAALREADQAHAVLDLVETALPAAYREHHRDLLFHQDDAFLLNSFFFCRACEALLAVGGLQDDPAAAVSAAVRRLNDFLGHRPLAVLHNGRQTEPYSHERVRPVPIYLRDVGPAVGKYEGIVRHAIQILARMDKEILEEADFRLELLDELAIDPRAYDFGHPVNRRPNYQFGEWDPHLIDNKGDYRRFVVRQITIDALLNRVDGTRNSSSDDLLWEAGAVLAGVILMGAGTSGGGPERHDSSVTLTSLVGRIAAYRDRFYHQLIAKLDEPAATRLREEAERTRQPFGGARQHLNRYLARMRAAQMQHVELARLFAEMGFPAASRKQALVIPVPRGRIRSEISCGVQLAHFDLDGGKFEAAAERLPAAIDLLHRAVECGAFVDPWNILAFSGQFSIFPTVESSVHDHRVEELVELVERLFHLSMRLVSEGSARGRTEPIQKVIGQIHALADWWDQFAATEVNTINAVSGRETYDSAVRLADILGLWKRAGAASGDMAFWRAQLERFNSPKSYSLVIEALLEQADYVAALALLMQWMSQSEQVPLEQDSFSFYQLAQRWMLGGASTADGGASHRGLTGGRPQRPRRPWALVRKFFDFLEVNAESLWDVPKLDHGASKSGGKGSRGKAGGTAGGAARSKKDDPDDLLEEEEDEDNPFGAAYEGMIYKDSARDGVEGSMMQGGGAAADTDDWLQRSQWLPSRLRFFSNLADLWRIAVLRQLPLADSAEAAAPALAAPAKPSDFASDDWADCLEAWFERARRNQEGLLQLLQEIQRLPTGSVLGTNEAMLEDDRQRRIQAMLAQEVLMAWLANERAAMAMAAAFPEPRLEALPAWSQVAAWQRKVILLERIARTQTSADVKVAFDDVVEELRREPLLYVPLSKGGDPRRVSSCQRIQQVLRDLLRMLPRSGLFASTARLVEAVREMEKRFPAGARAVTEFDRLFQIGFQAIIEHLTVSCGTWDAAFDPEDRLVELVQTVTEGLLKQWLQHSQSVRLSVLERISDESHWQRLVQFIRTYGKELFTNQFTSLGNLRTILFRGLGNYVQNQLDNQDPDDLPAFYRELGNEIPRDRTLADVELIMEALAENYEYYKDYSSTTTQSDSGDNLHIFLDFLRLKTSYDRVAWHLRPLALAHEILVRQGKFGAAEGWRRVVSEKTGRAAEWHLERLAQLERKYGVQLPTVGDRIREQFMRPFQLDRIRALVKPAVEEAPRGEDSPSMAALERELEDYARTPTGSGLDLPQWLVLLGNEVRDARHAVQSDRIPGDLSPPFPQRLLTLEEAQAAVDELNAASGGA